MEFLNVVTELLSLIVQITRFILLTLLSFIKQKITKRQSFFVSY